MTQSRTADVAIAGGGIIGLSLGLELLQRGLSVTVLERDRAMRQASWAAGGMLAARDPETPPALLPLALRSLDLYPEYLERIAALSGVRVPLRTRRTLLELAHLHPAAGFGFEDAAFREVRDWIPGFAPANMADRFVWLEEDSLDPRDLCRALPVAFRAAGGILLEESPVEDVAQCGTGIAVTAAQQRIHANKFVNCCGAWAGGTQFGEVPIAPVKGQMVSVSLGADRLRCVLRTPEFYAIPRGDGRIAVGATVEDAGFNRTVAEKQIADLLRAAAGLLPEIARASRLESWAGLRPGTPDGLPILGPAEAEHCWHASGHYRDGILLAPATARIMAQAILGEATDVCLDSFSPGRFQMTAPLASPDIGTEPPTPPKSLHCSESPALR